MVPTRYLERDKFETDLIGGMDYYFEDNFMYVFGTGNTETDQRTIRGLFLEKFLERQKRVVAYQLGRGTDRRLPAEKRFPFRTLDEIGLLEKDEGREARAAQMTSMMGYLADVPKQTVEPHIWDLKRFEDGYQAWGKAHETPYRGQACWWFVPDVTMLQGKEGKYLKQKFRELNVNVVTVDNDFV